MDTLETKPKNNIRSTSLKNRTLKQKANYSYLHELIDTNTSKQFTKTDYKNPQHIPTLFYHQITENVLKKFYSKTCPKCDIKLSKPISTRPLSIRCPTCFYTTSKISETPLHQFKLPLWMFGYVLHESILLHPQVLTSAQIKRRLNISHKSSLLLKRRIQLFCTDLNSSIEKLIYRDLEKEFKDFNLPKDGTDITTLIKGRPIPHGDTLVLFSASQRANQGRKRYKNTGQTASIYMADNLGGKQIGTLVHTISVKKGPVILTSIPNQQANTIGPLLVKHLPKHCPFFTDEGYKFYYRINKNHRMVNHSLKSKDKRYKFSRERWCKNGVNNQSSEGTQGLLKKSFSAYGWIKPEHSQLYLNEWSFFKNLNYYTFKEIQQFHLARKRPKELHVSGDQVGEATNKTASVSNVNYGYLPKVRQVFFY